MENLRRLLLNSVFVVCVAAPGGSIQMLGADLELTKDLPGATGSPSMANADYSLAYALGEPVAGDTLAQSPYTLISGYYGGRFGNSQTFGLLSSQVGLPGIKTFFQNSLQVGVPFDAPIQLTFSDPLDMNTVLSGIQVVIVTDHLGNPSGAVFPVTITADQTNQVVTILPQTAWVGNTLYDVQMTQQLRNIDEVPLDPVNHVYFVTMLDPHQDNVVLDPLTVPAAASAQAHSPIEAMSIRLPAESLSDTSVILVNRDPLHAPMHVDPNIIQQANTKAQAAGGAYRSPLSVQEIYAYTTRGDLLGPLSRQAELTVDYGGDITAPSTNNGLIRPQTLALYVLDEAHALWVKIAASQNAPGLNSVTAPVTQLSVFALMGNTDGSATDSFVFPVPWRPHGPNAGTGPGQTGTEAGGLIFSNLPSECSIKIYTIAGDLVRDIHHSDVQGLIGQEKWDAKTTHGEAAASGVYLWRVDSSVDGKNGKLMVIR